MINVSADNQKLISTFKEISPSILIDFSFFYHHFINIYLDNNTLISLGLSKSHIRLHTNNTLSKLVELDIKYSQIELIAKAISELQPHKNFKVDDQRFLIDTIFAKDSEGHFFTLSDNKGDFNDKIVIISKFNSSNSLWVPLEIQ